MASFPRINTQLGARQTLELRRKARLPVHHPSACSGVKALRNTSLAKAASRQAPLAFRSLDPFRALREPDCRRRDEKRPFPLRTKNFSTTQNNRLTGKAPYKSANLRSPARDPGHTTGSSTNHRCALATDKLQDATSPSRDRWFESGFLQRGVRCELDSRPRRPSGGGSEAQGK